MSSTAPKTELTADDLLSIPDGDHYELIDGELVERQMGSVSSWIAGRVILLNGTFAEEHELGWVWPADAGYHCFSDSPDKVRKPDVSFIRRGRLPDERPSTGFETIAPDLVVEVISPHDLFYRVDEKVEDFLQTGTRLVWVVNSPTRTVTIHRCDGSTARRREDEELYGEDVLPGFRCRASEIFLPPVKVG